MKKSEISFLGHIAQPYFQVISYLHCHHIIWPPLNKWKEEEEEDHITCETKCQVCDIIVCKTLTGIYRHVISQL